LVNFSQQNILIFHYFWTLWLLCHVAAIGPIFCPRTDPRDGDYADTLARNRRANPSERFHHETVNHVLAFL